MSQNPDFEETSLFDLFPAEEKKTDKKEQKNEKTEDAAPKDGRGKESAVTAVKAIKPETAPGKEEIPVPQLKDCPVSATPAWTEKFWEYDITKPSQWIRDDMKEHMVAEGFTKREANHIFRGLVFKEKIFNTKNQALAYLKTVPTTYAVKYKIGIEPSPRMVSLKNGWTTKRHALKNIKTIRPCGSFVRNLFPAPYAAQKSTADILHRPPVRSAAVTCVPNQSSIFWNRWKRLSPI
ncbi:hypothetical protein [Dialister invisus]|nr:hypothetical protein [Dialister invisus]